MQAPTGDSGTHAFPNRAQSPGVASPSMIDPQMQPRASALRASSRTSLVSMTNLFLASIEANSSLSSRFPPATLAGNDFTAAANGRGISQVLGGVASDGAEIVAVGSQQGASIARSQFFEHNRFRR